MVIKKGLDISKLFGYTGSDGLKFRLLYTGAKMALDELSSGNVERAKTILGHTLKETGNEADLKKN